MCPNATAAAFCRVVYQRHQKRHQQRHQRHHQLVSRTLTVLLLIFCCAPRVCSGLPLSEFYPYDLNTDTPTELSDDGGSEIDIDVDFPFFNRTDYRTIFVNNNGIISFISKLLDYQPKPLHLMDKGLPIVAPFWSDIDIVREKSNQDTANKAKNLNESVVFRLTNESSVVDLVSRDISENFGIYHNYRPRLVLIVTWFNVGFYGAAGNETSKRNTFQSVLTTDGQSSFAIFNYNTISWTTGANSGGNSGLGGHQAVVGFHSGDVSRTYSLSESGTRAIINITQFSNVDIPGKFIFKIDGPTINDLRCKYIGSVNVSPKFVSTLGFEPIILSGPCTVNGITPRIRLHLYDWILVINCSIFDETSALCVTPTVFYTGEVTMEYDPFGAGDWIPTPTLTINPISGTQPKLNRTNPGSWTPGTMVRVRWDKDEVPQETDTTLQVLTYTENGGVPAFVTLQTFAVSSTATERRFNLLTSSSYQDKDTLVIRLCYRTSKQGVSTLPQCIWSDVFPLWINSEDSLVRCQRWIKFEETELPPVVNTPPNCPCTLTMAERDLCAFHVDPFCDKTNNSTLNCIYQPSAQQCMRRNIKFPSDTGENCCYDAKGELMDVRQHPGAGTHNRHHYQAQAPSIVPYFSYFRADLLPRLHCCQYSSSLDSCRKFRKYRHETTCTGYDPPSPAQAAGDPHLVTLDGKNYSFNGVGEFILVEDTNSSMVIQVRAEQAVDSKGVKQNATVFSSVAIVAQNVSDVIEIRKKQDGTEAERSEVFVNSVLHTADTSDSQFKGIALQKTLSNPDNYLIVLESISLSLTVEVTSEQINIIVLIGQASLRGNLRGLLGNYNGNQADDFIARNGTVIPGDAKMSSVHYDFGMTWAVQDGDSILLPLEGVAVNPDFQPVFLDDALLVTDAVNDTDVICGDNLQCQFDYRLTQNKEAARQYVAFSAKFDDLKKELSTKVVRCPFLDVPPNGNRTLEGQSVGSMATFTCDQGYEMIQGSAERRCDDDGSWTGAEVHCALKITKSSVDAYIYAASGAGGLVFIIIIVVILFKVYRCRTHKNDTQSSHEQNEMSYIPEPSQSSQPIFQNPAFMERLNDLVKEGKFRIPRPNYVDPNIFEEYF